MPCSVAGSTVAQEWTSNCLPYFRCDVQRPRSRSDSPTCAPSSGPTAVTSSVSALTGPRPVPRSGAIRAIV